MSSVIQKIELVIAIVILLLVITLQLYGFYSRVYYVVDTCEGPIAAQKITQPQFEDLTRQIEQLNLRGVDIWQQNYSIDKR